MVSIVLTAAPGVEVGTINGAQFRIDVPENWNGSLVVYCHGYNPKPAKYKEDAPNGLMKEYLSRGYAIAQSGYAAGGWAIQEAVVDIESLRRYFVAKHGAPRETWITGHSMGGTLTAAMMEKYPTVYDGGLPLCGALGSAADTLMSQGAFRGRVIFDYYFPGLLSSPAAVTETDDVQQKIMTALDGDAAKSEIIRRMFHFKSNRDAAGVLAFMTPILRELQQRAGGNPFDNMNLVYSGSPDDNALNDGVKRYVSDPKAAAYLRTFYTPTGKIAKPMLAIHTTYDPLVPPWVPNSYQAVIDHAGNHELFVQQYVKRDGHCSITPAETARAFDELREWAKSGKRPPVGDRTIGAAAASGR